MSAIAEMGMAAAAGGGMQLLSEGMKAVHGLVNVMSEAFRANMMATNKEFRENIALANKNQNDAAKRSPAWLRAIIAIIVFVAAFILSYVNGWTDTVTSIVSDREPWLNLFNILRFGGGTKVTEAHGFVLTPEFWQTVRIIAGFLFGVGAVRTGKRVV